MKHSMTKTSKTDNFVVNMTHKHDKSHKLNRKEYICIAKWWPSDRIKSWGMFALA